MQASQFSLIFDELYTEKHNLFSSKVIKWQQAKQHFLTQTYKKTIETCFVQMDIQNKRFEKLIHQLLKVTNAEYQILTKVKPISEDKDLSKSKQSIPLPVQLSLSPQQQQLFTTPIQKSHKKASLMHEMCQFSARFFAITSTELNQFKSMQSQIQNRKQRYLFDLKKQVTEGSKFSQQFCVKNEAKYFQLKNFQKLRQSMDRQVKILVKTHQDARMYQRQSIEKRKEILKDCVDNMARFEELYSKIFCGKILQEIQSYFEKLIEQITTEHEKFSQDSKQFEQSRVQIKKRLEQLHISNVQIFKFVIEETALGEWRHVQLEATKKSSFTSFSSLSFSSNHALRQQTQHQSSNVQFQLPQTGQESRIQDKFGFVMTITVDYKLLFRKQADRSRIYKELIMNDVKMKSEKEKKVSDLRVLVLKDKKTKETIELVFPDTNRKEEFILHFNRFEQFKNSLNK